MKRQIRVLCMVVLALTALASNVIAKDAKLTFAPPEGLTLHYKVDVQQEVYVQGFEIVNIMAGEFEMKWLETTDNGNSKISIIINKIEASIQRGNDLQEIDMGIEGTEAWVTVTPQGEVKEVVPKSVLNKEKTSQVEELANDLIAFFSEEKVGEGDSWKKDLTKPSSTPDAPAEVTGEGEYFLDEFKKSDGLEVAKIVGEGKVEINMMTPGGLLTGKGKGDQETVVALDGGYIVKAKSFLELKGELGSGQDMSMVRRFECELK